MRLQVGVHSLCHHGPCDDVAKSEWGLPCLKLE
jgi:hypothetical protein